MQGRKRGTGPALQQHSTSRTSPCCKLWKCKIASNVSRCKSSGPINPLNLWKAHCSGDVNAAVMSPLRDTHVVLPWAHVEVASRPVEAQLCDDSPSVPFNHSHRFFILQKLQFRVLWCIFPFFIHYPSLVSLLVCGHFPPFYFLPFFSCSTPHHLVVTSFCSFLISSHSFFLLFFLSSNSFPSAPWVCLPFSSGSDTHWRGQGVPVNLCLSELNPTPTKRGHQRVQLLSVFSLCFLFA